MPDVYLLPIEVGTRLKVIKQPENPTGTDCYFPSRTATVLKIVKKMDSRTVGVSGCRLHPEMCYRWYCDSSMFELDPDAVEISPEELMSAKNITDFRIEDFTNG